MPITLLNDRNLNTGEKIKKEGKAEQEFLLPKAAVEPNAWAMGEKGGTQHSLVQFAPVSDGGRRAP